MGINEESVDSQRGIGNSVASKTSTVRRWIFL